MAKRTATPATKPLDPDSINARLYRQVGELLTQLETGEHITLKERVSALIAIGRMQQIFMSLRKGSGDENERAGTTVKKYATAFTHAAGGGATNPRPDDDEPEPDDWFEREPA